MPDNLSHADAFRVFRETIPSLFPSHTVHPTTLLEIEHDVFEETFGNVVTPGELDNRDGKSAVMIDKSKQGAKRIIRAHGELHGEKRYRTS
jgi:hypothetical protein